MILDVGCGENKISSDAIGIDLAVAPGVDIIASAECLPFREKSFDYVVASEVLEHLDDVDLAVTEACRVMQDAGELLTTTPRDTLLWHTIWSLWSNTFGRKWRGAHKRHFTEDWLLEVLSRRMKVVQTREINRFLLFCQAKMQG